jgi:hypothetical protein
MKTIVIQVMSWNAECGMDNDYTAVWKVNDEDFEFLKEKHAYFTSDKMYGRIAMDTDIIDEIEDRSEVVYYNYEPEKHFPMSIDAIIWVEVEFKQ